MTEIPRGRAVPPLPAHTFRDSGITVQLRKLGPNIVDDLQAAVRAEWRRSHDPDQIEPQPPMVQAGDLPAAPNRADPEYQRAHRAWELRLITAVYDRLLTFAALWAVECAIDPEAVAAYRRVARLTGVPLPSHPDWTEADQDRVLYVTRIAIGTNKDLEEFRQALLRRTGPSEQEVAAAADAFRGDMGRPASAVRGAAPAAIAGELSPSP